MPDPKPRVAPRAPAPPIRSAARADDPQPAPAPPKVLPSDPDPKHAAAKPAPRKKGDDA